MKAHLNLNLQYVAILTFYNFKICSSEEKI